MEESWRFLLPSLNPNTAKVIAPAPGLHTPASGCVALCLFTLSWLSNLSLLPSLGELAGAQPG